MTGVQTCALPDLEEWTSGEHGVGTGEPWQSFKQVEPRHRAEAWPGSLQNWREEGRRGQPPRLFHSFSSGVSFWTFAIFSPSLIYLSTYQELLVSLSCSLCSFPLRFCSLTFNPCPYLKKYVTCYRGVLFVLF